MNCMKTFENSKWILLKSGLWTTQEITKCTILKLIFNFVFNAVVFMILCYNIINAIKQKNLKLLNRMICILISMINYIAKSSTLMVNRKCFKSILLDLGSHIFNGHDEILNKHIQFIYGTSRLLLRYFTVTLVANLIIGSFLPMVTNIGLVIPAPFDTGRFDFVYKIAHVFATCYMAFNTIGFDMLYLTFLSLCVAQLNILEGRLETIFEDSTQNYSDKQKTNFVVNNILRDIIILHEKINRFVQKLSMLLSFPLFIQYTCGCFILCNTVVQLTLLREPGSMTILSMCGYAGISFAQMTAYHWLGNEIIFKSDKIIESSYISKWYQLEPSSQKTLLLLMERAKRPLVVKLYKFIFISLDSMGVIVRWAYSLFALIKARYG